MRWRASCSATKIFRECGDHPIAGSWLILFPVEMGFRFVWGIGMFRTLVCGIGMSRRIISGIGRLRSGELVVLLICETAMVGCMLYESPGREPG